MSFPSTLFGWSGSTYQSTATPTAWQGYWCKAATQSSVGLSPLQPPHTSGLTSGWNLIGNPTSVSVSLLLPSGRTAFVYDASAGSYLSTTSLAPGQAAWVKAAAGESVTFQSAGP